MSIYVTTLVWKFSQSAGSTLLTALAIADFADDDGMAYPGVKTLAAKARSSERTTQYALGELRELGELQIDVGTGPRGCNTYRIQVHALRARAGGNGGSANSAGVQNTTEGGATGCTQTVIDTPKKKNPPTPQAEKVALVQDPETGLLRLLIPASFKTLALSAYPGIDVDGESQRAEVWINQNLSKCPRSQYGRFLNSWLSRAFKDQSRPALRVVAGGRAGSKQEGRRAMTDWLFGQEDEGHQGDPNVIDVDSKQVG